MPSLTASTYAQDGAKGREHRIRPRGCSKIRLGTASDTNTLVAKDLLVKQLPEQHRCLALILTANIFVER